MTTGDERGYNGWKNYETWGVSLVLNNEEWSYTKLRNIARDDSRTVYERAAIVKEWIEEMVDVTDMRNGYVRLPDTTRFMFDQLLGAALCEVDWREIVENAAEE